MAEHAETEMWGALSDRFELLEEHLVYVDAPLEGFLRAIRKKELFAFRCRAVVPGCLWHWVLIPVSSLSASIDAAFEAARATPKDWLSIVEDLRREPARLWATWMTSRQALPDDVLRPVAGLKSNATP
ncbi:hypothetical protein P2318_29135 [Myxococcaceae bacterium GXIMD 01537]